MARFDPDDSNIETPEGKPPKPYKRGMSLLLLVIVSIVIILLVFILLVIVGVISPSVS